MDNAVCSAVVERGMWKQVTSGKVAVVASRLVCVFIRVVLLDLIRFFLCYRQSSLKAGFKKPGKSGMNVFRAVLITGPPGIGKTTSAHLCAKLEGYTPIELNASDARSKKLVEVLFSLETDIILVLITFTERHERQ